MLNVLTMQGYHVLLHDNKKLRQGGLLIVIHACHILWGWTIGIIKCLALTPARLSFKIESLAGIKVSYCFVHQLQFSYSNIIYWPFCGILGFVTLQL